jgi:hypothetical protein
MSKQANDIWKLPYHLAGAAVSGVSIYGCYRSCYWLGSKFKKEFQKIWPSSKIDPAKLAGAAAKVTEKINGFASEGELSHKLTTLFAMADHLTVFSQVVKDKPLELPCLNALEDRVCTALGRHVFSAPPAMSLPSLLLKEDV